MSHSPPSEPNSHSGSPDLPPVVLDTNVFVAAGFNRRSHAARLVAAVRRLDLRMIWNEATRREAEFILGRIPPLSRYEVDDLFRPEARFDGATHPQHFTRIHDPDDRKFAALAQATGAILISRDAHLLQPRDEMEATILTASEYCRRYLEPDDAA